MNEEAGVERWEHDCSILLTASSEQSLGEPSRVHDRLCWNAKWRYECWGLGDRVVFVEKLVRGGEAWKPRWGSGSGIEDMRRMGTTIHEIVM